MGRTVAMLITKMAAKSKTASNAQPPCCFRLARDMRLALLQWNPLLTIVLGIFHLNIVVVDLYNFEALLHDLAFRGNKDLFALLQEGLFRRDPWRAGHAIKLER